MDPASLAARQLVRFVFCLLHPRLGQIVSYLSTNSLATLFGWLAEGKIKPHISHTLPLTRVEEGLALLRERKSTGKVVITPT